MDPRAPAYHVIVSVTVDAAIVISQQNVLHAILEATSRQLTPVSPAQAHAIHAIIIILQYAHLVFRDLC